jgi:hypothetical protein
MPRKLNSTLIDLKYAETKKSRSASRVRPCKSRPATRRRSKKPHPHFKSRSRSKKRCNSRTKSVSAPRKSLSKTVSSSIPASKSKSLSLTNSISTTLSKESSMIVIRKKSATLLIGEGSIDRYIDVSDPPAIVVRIKYGYAKNIFVQRTILGALPIGNSINEKLITSKFIVHIRAYHDDIDICFRVSPKIAITSKVTDQACMPQKRVCLASYNILSKKFVCVDEDLDVKQKLACGRTNKDGVYALLEYTQAKSPLCEL